MDSIALDTLIPYVVPAVLTIAGMYFAIKGINRELVDIKEKMSIIADQQVEIARIHKTLDHHAFRLDSLEKK